MYVGSLAGGKPAAAEKTSIGNVCETFIATVLTPRHLPQSRPPGFNCPIALYGKWRGNQYRFITRYRTDDPSSTVAEFDAPFARLGYCRQDCFDLFWHRHTGEWFRLFRDLPLTEALHRIEHEPHFMPC